MMVPLGEEAGDQTGEEFQGKEEDWEEDVW